MIRRRLAVLVAGLIATGGVVSLPGARAAEPPVAPKVTATAAAPFCVWLDLLNIGGYCVRR